MVRLPTIHSKEELIALIKELGILPAFSNHIPGFSVEDCIDPAYWFPAEGEGFWEWKGPVIRESGFAYGKFFSGRAGYISPELYREFANYRRDGYDFDARWDDGLAAYGDKYLYDLVDQQGPLRSTLLKRLGGYGRDGRKGFDTAMNRLQGQCYVLIRDFVYAEDRHGRPYGWGLAEYDTPERRFGAAFTDAVYRRSPAESRARVLAHLEALCPGAPAAALEKLLAR